MACENKFKIKKVLFNNPATIVFWEDGTKTVVRAHDEPFDKEKGLAMAISKKAYGNKSSFNEIFKEHITAEETIRAIEIKPSDIERIALLSTEEARLFPKNILKYNYHWWLRSPGDLSDTAAFVFHNGSISDFGFYIGHHSVAVRPALKLNLKSKALNVKDGDIVNAFDRDWYVQGNLALLMGEPLIYMAFNRDIGAPNANDYYKSSVKKFLGRWFEEQLSQQVLKDFLKDDLKNIRNNIINLCNTKGN